jgi:molybdenum cofactor biosynthesis enzyme MoaA
MVDEYLKSSVCMLPWTSIETRPGGTYTPCCLYKGELKKPNGVPYNTRENTISEVMSSKEMQELRDKFRNNERPLECINCWKEEDAGKTSKRQHMWKKATLLGQVHVQKDIVAPRFIDLKLGNICNLKCRICSPYSSSVWATEMAKFHPDRKKHWTEFNKEGMWPREKNVFYEDLDKHLESIRFFEITGGEPLMIKEQFDILQKCVDRGVAKNIDVHYNTNGTQFPEKELNEIWPHFKRIELAYSIDDIKKRFEYQRHPAKWDLVNKNILKFKKAGLKNLSTQVCTTINVFNIAYLDELAPYIDEWGPDYWYINVLHQPEEFDVQQLPKGVKKLITDKLSKTKIRKDEIMTALGYLNSEPNTVVHDYNDAIRNRIKIIDKRRNENFSEVFPLLNKELKVYE